MIYPITMVHVLFPALLAIVWVSTRTAASSLYFDFRDVSAQPGDPVELTCGVEGPFHVCVWETQRGEVYQVRDVHAGLHAGLRAPANLTNNQCGIVVDTLSERSLGAWTCRVYLPGTTLRAEKRVGEALDCPEPFLQVGSGCYYFHEDSVMNWDDAQQYCQGMSPNADLAVLDDCYQFELVWNYLLVHYGDDWRWIGGSNRSQEGSWQWVTDEPVAMGIPFWLSGQPDGGGSCLDLSTPYGYFNDYYCTETSTFVCQIIDTTSPAASSLYFDFSDISARPGDHVELTCGVEGSFHMCVWDTQRGEIYQVQDVHAGLHAGLRAPANLTNNQCGIAVDALSERSFGAWTCRVYLPGTTLRAEKRVGEALDCPEPFLQVGSGCYYFNEDSVMNWDDAQQYCQIMSASADLAVLDDCYQLELVWNYILVNYGTHWHWIGGTDRYQQGSWHWVTGEPVAMGTPFWRPGSPNGEGSCLDLSQTYGYFNDYGCNYTSRFVCQILY